MNYTVTTYLFMNMFRIYVTYKFFYIFFDKCRCRMWQEHLLYVIYWAVNSFVYLAMNNPMLTFLSNILFMVIISHVYEGDFKRRLEVIVAQFVLATSVELLIVILFEQAGILEEQKSELSNSYTYVVVNILTFVLTVVLGKRKKVKNGVMIPLIYWVQILLYTVMTMVLLTTVYLTNINQMMTMICALSIVVMDITVFTLYEYMIDSMNKNAETRLVDLQNRSYEAQLDILSDTVAKTRDMRHDMRNHMGMISNLITNGQYEEAKVYANKYVEVNTLEHWYSRTGDVGLDSIINYKLGEAAKAGIEVDAEIMLNGIAGIDTLDFVTIMGNIIDNAIEAASASPSRKYLALKIRRAKDNIIIYMENTYGDKPVAENGRYRTTKKKGEHGIGLSNVEKTLERYDGSMILENNEQLFQTHIILSIAN